MQKGRKKNQGENENNNKKKVILITIRTGVLLAVIPINQRIKFFDATRLFHES
jgi:hypothetical protein